MSVVMVVEVGVVLALALAAASVMAAEYSVVDYGARRAGGRTRRGVPRRVGGGVRRRRRAAGDARPAGRSWSAGVLPRAVPQRRRCGARHRRHRGRAAGRRQRVVDHVPLRPRPRHPRRHARRQRPRLLGVQGRRRPPLPSRHHSNLFQIFKTGNMFQL